LGRVSLAPDHRSNAARHIVLALGRTRGNVRPTMSIRHFTWPLSSALLAFSSVHAQTTRAGFVTTLGRDTVALESYERSASRLEGDVVIRVPGTVHFHYLLDLRSNGTVSHSTLTMDPLGVGRLSASTSSLDFPADSGTVPFFMTGFESSFGLYSSLGIAELLLANVPVSATDTVRFASVDVATGRRVTRNFMRPSATSAAIDFFKIAWTHLATDSTGHVLSADMSETTEKVRTVRTAPIDIGSAAKAFAARDRAGAGVGVASPDQLVNATIGGKSVVLSFGSPRRRNREILGLVVPYDKIWRTGANAATTLITPADLTIGGARIPAGSYSLWTLPTRSGVQLIINSQSGQWGTSYDAKRDVARVAMQTSAMSTPKEDFAIEIAPTGTNSAELHISWDTFKWSVPVTIK
jgi:hypothetical protein